MGSYFALRVYYILLILFSLINLILFNLLDINNSPTKLKVYKDIIEYYQIPHRTDVISNIFTDYEIKIENSVIKVLVISYCIESVILTIGCLITCKKGNSGKFQICYFYLCHIILIASKIVIMIFLLKLRHYRIESIKPVISKYIQREEDIAEFDKLNNKAAEKDKIFFIINLIVCSIIFIIIAITTILILKENDCCPDCACDCTRRHYINNFTSNNINNTNNNMNANNNNNNVNNAYENRNTISHRNIIVNNSNENVNSNSNLNLNKTKYKKKNEEKCIICQEMIIYNDEVIYLPCFHFFHPNCIEIWLRNKKICPFCRRNI